MLEPNEIDQTIKELRKWKGKNFDDFIQIQYKDRIELGLMIRRVPIFEEDSFIETMQIMIRHFEIIQDFEKRNNLVDLLYDFMDNKIVEIDPCVVDMVFTRKLYGRQEN